MRVYADTSALIKRAIDEPESEALEAALEDYAGHSDVLVSSSLAWIEVSRAVRARPTGTNDPLDEVDATEVIESALSGVAERPITREVVGLARRVAPPILRTLDAIHLATAVLLDADMVLVYDRRLADACLHNGLPVTAPGRSTTEEMA